MVAQIDEWQHDRFLLALCWVMQGSAGVTPAENLQYEIDLAPNLSPISKSLAGGDSISNLAHHAKGPFQISLADLQRTPVCFAVLCDAVADGFASMSQAGPGNELVRIYSIHRSGHIHMLA